MAAASRRKKIPSPARILVRRERFPEAFALSDICILRKPYLLAGRDRLSGVGDHIFISQQDGRNSGHAFVRSQHVHVDPGGHIAVAQGGLFALHDQDELALIVLVDGRIGDDIVIVDGILGHGQTDVVSRLHLGADDGEDQDPVVLVFRIAVDGFQSCAEVLKNGK